MNIRYQHYTKFPGCIMRPGVDLSPGFLASLIDQHNPQVVFEVGSGANPTMDIAEVNARHLRYITSDMSEEELRKAPAGYETRQVKMDSPSLPSDLIETCDMVFSRMVNEHIQDGWQYHANIFKMLRRGGIAVHCFSTLYALPFLANYILPDGLSDLVLRVVSPRSDYYKTGKFRAHYSWSRGPTRRMLRRFDELGFEIMTYDGYFGHLYYRRRLPWLDVLEEAKTKLLLRNPHPNLCSFATVTLRKSDHAT